MRVESGACSPLRFFLVKPSHPRRPFRGVDALLAAAGEVLTARCCSVVGCAREGRLRARVALDSTASAQLMCTSYPSRANAVACRACWRGELTDMPVQSPGPFERLFLGGVRYDLLGGSTTNCCMLVLCQQYRQVTATHGMAQAQPAARRQIIAQRRHRHCTAGQGAAVAAAQRPCKKHVKGM